MKNAILLTLLLASASARAATVNLSGGLLTIDYSGTALLGLSNPNHFTLPDTNTLTVAQMQNLATPGNILAETGLPFVVNTGVIGSPAGRFIQSTTMTYDPANLTGTVTGQAGFAGVTRWNYIFGGGFLLGDYTLEYSGSRAVAPNSGWYLENHYGGIEIPTWDLANVTAVINGDNFSLSGDMLISPEFALGFGLTAGEDRGNFSFASVPEPSVALLGLSGLALALHRRRQPGVR